MEAARERDSASMAMARDAEAKQAAAAVAEERARAEAAAAQEAAQAADRDAQEAKQVCVQRLLVLERLGSRAQKTQAYQLRQQACSSALEAQAG